MQWYAYGELMRRIMTCAVLGVATGARGAKHEGGHADDRVGCRSDRPEVAIGACTNIIDDDRLDEF